MKDKTKFIMFVDSEGNIRGRDDFENSMKWDSPNVVRIIRKKLSESKKRK